MPPHSAHDVLPLSRRQLGALWTAASRQLLWGLRESGHELGHWRNRADAIPDPTIRADAIDALTRKRTHADGAALFAILPKHRDPELLRLFVAYETILDFLDNLSERHRGEENGRELHLALIDAVEPDHPLADYYRHHPVSEDGGYLRALVEACRRRCRRLPSYGCVRSLLAREARRTQVLALNHLPDPGERDEALSRWARAEFPRERRLLWFELSGAASASLVILALLELGSRERLDDREVIDTYSAYWPWMSLVAVMLDSYSDQEEDRHSGEHSYVAHYASPQLLVERLCEFVDHAAAAARALPNGHRHAVIVGCMVSMYLSKDSARAPEMERSTGRLVRAGGSLTRLLMPVLRGWRTAYLQRSA